MMAAVKRFWPLIAVLLVAVVAFETYNYINTHVGTIIKAHVVPGDATIKIDNGKTVRVGNIKTTPGTHTLVISRNGFTTATVTVNINKNEKKPIYKMLTAANSVGYAWLQSHPKEATIGGSYAGQEYNQNADQALQKNPITSHLPWIDNQFKIDYGRSQKNPNDPTATALYITTYSEEGKQEALALIQHWGYDPNKLEIIYQPQPGFN